MESISRGIASRVGLSLMLGMAALSTVAGCGPRPQSPAGAGEAVPWVAPSWQLRPGDQERTEAALLAVDRVGDLVRGEDPDDFVVAPQLCGNRMATFDHGTAEVTAKWELGEVRLLQAAMSFNTTVPSGAAAIEEVRTRTTCGSFMDRDGRHHVIQVPGLASVAGTDASYLVCEELRAEQSADVEGARCTAMLARDDVVSALYAIAPTRVEAESTVRKAAELSAAALVAGW